MHHRGCAHSVGGGADGRHHLSGTGYEKLYLGTGEAALGAGEEEDWIAFVEDDGGSYTYKLPVSALDEPLDVAAFSTRKQTWYDRVLVFQSASLPEEAFPAAQS